MLKNSCEYLKIVISQRYKIILDMQRMIFIPRFHFFVVLDYICLLFAERIGDVCSMDYDAFFVICDGRIS